MIPPTCLTHPFAVLLSYLHRYQAHQAEAFTQMSHCMPHDATTNVMAVEGGLLGGSDET